MQNERTPSIRTEAMKVDEPHDLKSLVPTDAPCVWLSCDVQYGRASKLVDVWTAAPRRNVSSNGAAVDRSVDYTESSEGTHLGTFTRLEVYERFDICPSGDECISIDNPKVS